MGIEAPIICPCFGKNSWKTKFPDFRLIVFQTHLDLAKTNVHSGDDGFYKYASLF
jgi:hypothetical protein